MAPATEVFRDADTHSTGERYRMKVLQVPQSDDYPLGLKYSFQYMDVDGTTLLRFDNYPHHPGVDTHHRHTCESVESIEYTDINDHIDRFYEEMDQIHDERHA
jgi:hypothetical protein